MPAWSVPGRYKVLCPRIRCQRVRISISVCSNMCPMCSEPVTFGGGITIENTGPGALGSALNSSSLTQYSAQRGSICCGSYALAISRAIPQSTPDVSRTCTRGGVLFIEQGNLRLYGGKTSSVNCAPNEACWFWGRELLLLRVQFVANH